MSNSPTRLRFLARLAVIALSALVLQACSAVKIAYDQAPALLAWQADRYLNLDSTQKAQLRADFESFQAWHRSTQLPLYADFLAKNRPLLAADFSPAQACVAWSEAKMQLQAALDALGSVGLGLLPGLSPGQLDHLETKLAASNADWREEWLQASAQDRSSARYKQLLSRSESLYGTLGAEQRKALQALLANSSFDAQKSYALRLARQAEMLKLLRPPSPSGPAPDSSPRKAFLRSLLAMDPQSAGPYQTALRQETCALFAAIHQLTTPGQRAQALDTLRSYEEDLRSLALRP